MGQVSLFSWPHHTGGASAEESSYQCRRLKKQVQSLGWEDSLEKEMATRSGTLAWEISWAEEPGGLRSMGSHRAGHN